MATWNRFSTIGAIIIAGGLPAACAPLEAPTNDSQGASRFVLEPLLRQGSGFLCPPLELHFEFYAVGDDIDAEVSSVRQPDGSTLVFVSGTHTMTFANDTTSANFHCFGWFANHGVHSIEMPAAPPTSLPPTRLLPFTHGTLIQSWKTLWWKIGSPSAVEIDIQSLSGIIGIRADRTGPMTMSDREGMVVFTRWTIDETPKANLDGDEVLFSIPAGSVLGSVRYADEVAPGVFAWVQTMGESAQYFRTDRSTPIDANLSEFNIKFVERNPDTGHIVLIGDAIHDWDVDGTGALITPPLPATSEGYAPWNIARRAVALSERSMPNPNAEQLRVPISYQGAFLEAETMVVHELPSTPCTDRESCRQVGEHYLLGAWQSANHRYGVYYSWPWLEDGIRPLLVVAPLP